MKIEVKTAFHLGERVKFDFRQGTIIGMKTETTKSGTKIKYILVDEANYTHEEIDEASLLNSQH